MYIQLRKGNWRAKMGMAASQARFLGLTARKTNVEYEGQQINQQRTCLANQSANYYNDMLGMSVPVPPSVDNFTKTVYTFNDGALTNSITALIAQQNGLYTLSYLSQWEDDFTPVAAATSVVTNAGNGVYMVGSDTLRPLGQLPAATTPTTPTPTPTPTVDPGVLTQEQANKLQYAYINPDTMENVALTKAQYESGNYPAELTYMYYIDDTKTGADAVVLVYENENGELTRTEPTSTTRPQTTPVVSPNYEDEYLNSLSADQLQQLMKEEEYYIDLLNEKYGNDTWMVRYVKNSDTGTYQPYFYRASDLTNGVTAGSNIISGVNCYTIGSATTTNEIKGVENCRVEKDSTGRYISLSIPDANGQYVTYALTTSTITDQDAYDDAMNQYEYEKYQYDQSIQEINAKIEIIQAQDKNLELRLKQLDTEQDAISTEMDAVQKVIEKNTESTFRTFG